MIKKIAILIALVATILLIYVALKPSEMFITREALIKASPDTIFPYINTPKKSDAWMPWKDIDPDVKTTYSGPAEGVGAASNWTSTGKMGTGQAVIVQSSANLSVKTALIYTKPMQLSQLAEVTLIPSKNGTIVRWSVKGKNKFVGRFMSVFMNMDKVIGDQFEKGLTNLKGIVEPKKG